VAVCFNERRREALEGSEEDSMIVRKIWVGCVKGGIGATYCEIRGKYH